MRQAPEAQAEFAEDEILNERLGSPVVFSIRLEGPPGSEVELRLEAARIGYIISRAKVRSDSVQVYGHRAV